MKKESKIYVAGHRGMAGSAIVRCLREQGYSNLILRTSEELDLRSQADTEAFFEKERPEYIFLAAAKVGGIQANMTHPGQFLYENIMIQSNVIHAAYRYKARKLLFLASSCIYPREAPQPMKEDYLLDGKVEPTNEGYAIAKIAGLKMCQLYNRQYGTDFISVMPCNLYGMGDNFHPERSHVVPALIRKFHEGKKSGAPFVEVWGTGRARRELMYADDLADACLFLMDRYTGEGFFNVGPGADISIAGLAETVRCITGYEGRIQYNPGKPDGMPRKLMDVGRIREAGWQCSASLQEGLRKTYEWYLKQEGETWTR